MSTHPTSVRAAGARIARCIPALLLVVLAVAPWAACATTVRDLYAAATPVPDQSAGAREQAFSRDLVAVLVKVSGNPDAGQVAALQSAIESAGKLVVEYRYRTPSAAQGGGLVLRARFDPKAVDAALAQAGQGIWGRDRPTVVAWVLAPAGIVGDDPTNPVAAAMRQAAKERGLPLVIPLMDLTDQQQVSDFDVRTAFMPALTAASKRYGAQAVLVGALTQVGAGAAGRWTLAFGQTSTPFAVTAASPASAGAAGVDRAASLLAQQLAYQPGSGAEGVVMLVVDGVDSLGAEVRVRRMAAGVQGVAGVTLVRVAAGVARYRVRYAGVPADLARALALSGSLTQTAAPAPAGPLPSSAPAPASASLPSLYFHYGK